jgi:1,2-phenylacetyl-CoA epoxidase PaaB subunit
MAKTRQKSSTDQIDWEVYHLGRSGKRLGTVTAASDKEALQKAIDEFDIKPHEVSRTLVRPTR